MLCSGPEGLQHADLNVTVLRADVQIVQSFVVWTNEPSQINTIQLTIFGSVKYAELVDHEEDYANSKQSCTCCGCLIPKTYFFYHDASCISYYSKNHSMTLLWDRLCLLQGNFITVKAVEAY
jgi:hypothetical protein